MLGGHKHSIYSISLVKSLNKHEKNVSFKINVNCFLLSSLPLFFPQQQPSQFFANGTVELLYLKISPLSLQPKSHI